jgi:peptidoglycan/xylan/chitin deacetylase (PgdA/CDA1 family)
MRLLFRLLRALACFLGAHVVARRLHRRDLLIVNYHGLRADDDPRRSWLLLARSRFASQLDYLERHYRVVSIDAALGELWNGGLRAPTACITFDDGYRNNLTIGLPELERRRFPATIYLATGLIGADRRIWTTEVELLFEQTRQSSVDLSGIGLGAWPLRTDAERTKAGFAVKERLKVLPQAERETALHALRVVLGVPRPDDGGTHALLDWSEVRAMEQTGLVTFGGHTVNHEILSTLADADVTTEVTESVRAVSSLGRGTSKTFAYPNGRRRDFDHRAVAALRAAGRVAAVTTIGGLNTPQTDRFALRRVVIGDRVTMSDFKLMTSGFLSDARRVFGRPLDA